MMKKTKYIFYAIVFSPANVTPPPPPSIFVLLSCPFLSCCQGKEILQLLHHVIILGQLSSLSIESLLCDSMQQQIMYYDIRVDEIVRVWNSSSHDDQQLTQFKNKKIHFFSLNSRISSVIQGIRTWKGDEG